MDPHIEVAIAAMDWPTEGGGDFDSFLPNPADSPLTHVTQRESYDCGLTCVAILSGITYDEAAARDPRPRPIKPGRGLWIKEMIPFLERETGRKWKTWVSRSKELTELAKNPPGKMGALITRPFPGAGQSHWLVFSVGEGGEDAGSFIIHDPELTAPVRIEDYPGNMWVAGKGVVLAQ